MFNALACKDNLLAAFNFPLCALYKWQKKRGDLTVRIVDIVTWLLESPKEKGLTPLGLKRRNGK